MGQPALSAEISNPGGRTAHVGSGYWWLAATLIVVAVALVWWRAWVCDDAFITFHYVENCLGGRGLVFNPGERVQGFTHPLWCLILVGGATVLEPHRAAVVLGLFSTAAVLGTLAWRLRGSSSGRILLMLGFSFLFSSPTLVEYQTSGLEGCLTHLLLVLLCVTLLFVPRSRKAPVAAALLTTLLVLNRPDAAFLCGPILMWVLVQGWRSRCFRLVLLMMAPAAAWYGFAVLYYGTPFPNTAYAKVAFPLPVAAAKGAGYLLDYLLSEPAHALLTAGIATLGVAWCVHGVLTRKDVWVELCLACGVLLHLLYLVMTGGDFMRGRVILPGVVVAVMLTLHWLAQPAGTRFAGPALLTGIAAVFTEFYFRNGNAGILTGVGPCIRAVRDQLLYTPVVTTVVIATLVLFVVIALDWTVRSRRSAGPGLFVALAAIQLVLILGMSGQHRPAWAATLVVSMAALGVALVASLLVARRPLPGIAGQAVIVVLITVSCGVVRLKPPDDSVNPQTGITDECAFYQTTRAWHEFPSPDRYVNGNVRAWIRVGELARKYSQRFGPITLYYDTLGLVSHFAGPDVHLIDPHGLTDAFVARCPADPASRIGHVRRRIPRSYLESRAALTLLPDWRQRLAALDPTLKADGEGMAASAVWSEPAVLEEDRRIREVIGGPVFSWARLQLMPSFVLPKGWHSSP